MAEVSCMTVRVDHGHGYVEEFTDEQWAEIEQWSADLQLRMYGWMLRNPVRPAEVPAAPAGPNHPGRTHQG